MELFDASNTFPPFMVFIVKRLIIVRVQTHGVKKHATLPAMLNATLCLPLKLSRSRMVAKIQNKICNCFDHAIASNHDL